MDLCDQLKLILSALCDIILLLLLRYLVDLNNKQDARQAQKRGEEAISLYITKHPRAAMEKLPAVYASVALMAPKRQRRAPRDYPSFRPDQSLLMLLENVHTLILEGPTGMGKTSFILSWCAHTNKTPLFVTHMDQLKTYAISSGEGSYDIIIFDDMSFAHMPRTAQIHISDWDHDRTIHCRYRPAFIPAHTPKVILCNEYPFTHDPAVTRRVQLCHIRAPLF